MEFENKKLRDVADIAARIMMGEKALHPNQQKLDVHEPEKDELTSADFKKLRTMKKEETMHEESCECGSCPSDKDMKKEEIEDVSEMDYGGGKNPNAGHGLSHDDDDDGKKELTAKVAKGGNVVKSALDILNKQYVNKKDMKKEEVDLDEGKMGQLSADLKDLSHADFHKQYGNPKSLYDPSNFKKPVQKGKEMDRAKSLAQRGMASMKKEEVEDLSEATYVVKHDGVSSDHADADAKKLFAGKTNVNSHVSRYASSAEKHADMLKSKGFKNVRIQTMNKEEVEQMDEMFPGTPEYEKKYGKAPQDMKPGEKKKTTKGEMEKTEKGVVHKRKFSEMVESYTEGGVKGLFKTLAEEPTSAEFDAQLDDAKKRAAGTKKQPEVSKPAVQAVQNEETHTTVEFIDYNDVNGVKYAEIDLAERKLTAAETEKKEDTVKSMKKNLSGFKERYGKDAKSVMYATATKQAKGE